MFLRINAKRGDQEWELTTHGFELPPDTAAPMLAHIVDILASHEPDLAWQMIPLVPELASGIGKAHG